MKARVSLTAFVLLGLGAAAGYAVPPDEPFGRARGAAGGRPVNPVATDRGGAFAVTAAEFVLPSSKPVASLDS